MRLFSVAGNVITSSRTLLNTERAEQLIFIHENYWAVEPTIQKWQLRSDKERGRTKLPLSQPEEELVDDPQPSTSSQSLLTPKSSKYTGTPKSSKVKARKPILISDSESD
jgi:hypothetical protein